MYSKFRKIFINPAFLKVNLTTENTVNKISIIGDWNLIKNENADEYLKAVGGFKFI